MVSGGKDIKSICGDGKCCLIGLSLYVELEKTIDNTSAGIA